MCECSDVEIVWLCVCLLLVGVFVECFGMFVFVVVMLVVVGVIELMGLFG